MTTNRDKTRSRKVDGIIVPSTFTGQTNNPVQSKTSAAPVQNQPTTPAYSDIHSYYDAQAEQLKQRYAANMSALDESKRQSQQNASITLDKLKKYLPMQLKAQGLNGLGVSETSMLQAYNNYMNNMGEIENTYQNNKTNLINGNTDAVNALEEQRRNEVREQQRSDFETAYGTIANSTETSADKILENYGYLSNNLTDTQWGELQNYAAVVAGKNLEEQRNYLRNDIANVLATKAEGKVGEDGKMSASDYKELQEYVNQYLDKLGGNVDSLNIYLDPYKDLVRSEDEERKAELSKSIKTNDVSFYSNVGRKGLHNGDNFSVADGSGTEYKIQSGGEVSDNDIITAAENIGSGTVFGYKDNVYYKQDGKIYLVTKRTNTYGDDYTKLYSRIFK